MYNELRKIAIKRAYLEDYKHLLKPGLIGAGVGGLGALGVSAMQEPEDRRWLRNLLLGLTIGGGGGAAIGHGLEHDYTSQISDYLKGLGNSVLPKSEDTDKSEG